MIFCEYGCGQEAKYQLKNDKWCCSKSIILCLENQKKSLIFLPKRQKKELSRKIQSIKMKEIWNKRKEKDNGY